MQIGVLAKATGVSVQTVRYYERYGLLSQAQRNESAYRIYTDEHVRRIQFVLQAKTLGFSLEEIKEIIGLSNRRQCPCGRVVQIAEDRIADLNRQIEDLGRFRKELHRALMSWKRAPDKPSGDAICVLIERTMFKSKKARRDKGAQFIRKSNPLGEREPACPTNMRNRQKPRA